MEVAAAQIGLVHNSESKLEAEQGHQHHIAAAEENIAVAVVDGKPVVVVADIGFAAVAEDKRTPLHFVCTIPVWYWDSYTNE